MHKRCFLMKEVAEDIPFMSGREKCAWCDNFAPAQKDKRSDRLLKHCLNDLLTEISEIRKVIESEDDGDNTE